jgi:5-methylcytosine-specific restriction protein A
MADKLRNLPPRVAVADTRIARPGPKTVDPHYLTPEHRAWRAEVIRRSGGRCQDPDCLTPHRTDQRLFADHVRELRDDGAPFDPANGLARCGACHTRKTLDERTRRMARPT